MNSQVIKITLTLIYFISMGMTSMFSQGVSFREDQLPAHPSSILDIQSDSAGFLLPRMTTTQRNAIPNPADGLLVYDQNLKKLFNYNNTYWRDIRLGTTDTIWTLTGDKLHYTGGRVGIGTSSPASAMHLKSLGGVANLRLQNRNSGGGTASLLLHTPLSKWRFSITNSNMLELVNISTAGLVMSIGTDGKIGLGGIPGSDKMTVYGNVRCDDTFETTSIVGSGNINGKDAVFKEEILILSPSATQGGRLRLYGPTGHRIVNCTFLTGFPNNGFLDVYRQDESGPARFYVDSDGLGKVKVDELHLKTYRGKAPSASAGAKTDMYGTNGSLNTKVSFLNEHPENGFIGVYDNNGVQQASMYVNEDHEGVISADVKNFVEPHPNDPSKEIWYASLEGPELGAYCRGTAQLINGEAWVEWPEHFEIVINPATSSIQVSPLSLASNGLAVVEKTERGFRVKELQQGKGNYDFDWEAKGVRKGKEDFQVIRFKRDGPEGG